MKSRDWSVEWKGEKVWYHSQDKQLHEDIKNMWIKNKDTGWLKHVQPKHH